MNPSDLDPAIDYIFTIGHSNTPIDVLLDNLRAYDIEALVDVRSQPVSRFVPHFNRRALEETLAAHHVEYVFLGDALGGRPSDPTAYDSDGYVRYGVWSGTEVFRSGIDTVLELSRRSRVVLMCSEEDPRRCHRQLLISRVLRGGHFRNGAIIHIRRTGDAESDAEMTNQLDLAGAPWRSPAPLGHKLRARKTAPA